MSDAGERFSRLWRPPDQALSYDDAIAVAESGERAAITELLGRWRPEEIVDDAAIDRAYEDEDVVAYLWRRQYRICKKLLPRSAGGQKAWEGLAERLRETREQQQRGEPNLDPTRMQRLMSEAQAHRFAETDR